MVKYLHAAPPSPGRERPVKIISAFVGRRRRGAPWSCSARRAPRPRRPRPSTTPPPAGSPPAPTGARRRGPASGTARTTGSPPRTPAPATPPGSRRPIAAAGAHLVEVWYPADAGYNSATPFVVAASRRQPQRGRRPAGQRWSLGQPGHLHLAAGDYNVVGVSRWTNQPGYVVADAVRITLLDRRLGLLAAAGRAARCRAASTTTRTTTIPRSTCRSAPAPPPTPSAPAR